MMMIAPLVVTMPVATVVAVVHGQGPDGAVSLDHTTPPAAMALKGVQVQLIGSHFPEGSSVEYPGGVKLRRGQSIYIKQKGSSNNELDNRAMWVGARPSSSPWVGMSPTQTTFPYDLAEPAPG